MHCCEGPSRDAIKPDAAAALFRKIVCLPGLRLFCLVALILRSEAAMADDGVPPPVVAASFRDILDGWLMAGDHRAEPVAMNRAQLAVTLAADRLGVSGLALHVQVFNSSGSSLSAHTGDIQTADAIEAIPMTRLFEAWIEQRFGSEDHNIALRAGLMDVNADFDSIVAANWLLNSSHGIGADIARSGLNGPSVYPVSSLGLRAGWTPDRHWTTRVALLDGVPGDPGHPGTFVTARLAPESGALVIGQEDYRWSETGRMAIGFWRYSHVRRTLDNAATGHDEGFYMEVESALPGPRIGVAGYAMAARPALSSRSMVIGGQASPARGCFPAERRIAWAWLSPAPRSVPWRHVSAACRARKVPLRQVINTG
jgi:porin